MNMMVREHSLDSINTEMSAYQQFIALSRYARYLPDQRRRETWPETVARYCDFMRAKFPLFPRDRMYHAIVNLHVMPSMRAIMTAGKALEQDNVPAYNCAYVAVDDPRVFDEILYILMCGTGVGFSVERQFIKRMPEVSETLRESSTEIHVADSRAGWAHAVRETISLLYAGVIPRLDTSALRSAGAPLKTFGGRSSGPAPLHDLFRFLVKVFRGSVGRQLNSRECHDIVCKIAEVVVVGGVRRSALLSLSNLSDGRMANAKNGQWWENEPQRALANNSVAYTEKPEIGAFMTEWLSLYDSKSGERGIFNRQAVIKKMQRLGRRQYESIDFGTNPCFAADTLIVTDRGARPIHELVGETVTIHDGHEWRTIDNFRVTGTNQPMLRLTMQDGSVLRVTPAHTMILTDERRIRADRLQIGQKLKLSTTEYNGSVKMQGAYLKGFLLGDGSANKSTGLYLYEPKFMCEGRLIESALEVSAREMKTNGLSAPRFVDASSGRQTRKRMQGLSARNDELNPWASDYRDGLPSVVFSLDHASKSDFLAGVFDADGTVTDGANGFSYQFSNMNLRMLEDIQVLLKSIGVQSKIGVMHRGQEKGRFIRRDGVPYATKDCWRLSIPQRASVLFSQQVRFSRLPSHATKYVAYVMKNKATAIVSIEDDGVDDKVYCCTVPDTHSVALAIGVVTGQCAEINLRSRQFCNLTEVIVRAQDTEHTLREKVEIASILGTFQSALTDFKYLSSAWKKNVEEERLLGVSMTGIYDNAAMAGGRHDLDELLEELTDVAIDTNAEWADALGIHRSTSITTVKPSGTVSQLVDAASGIHPRFARHYVRTVRNDKKDPLSDFMIAQGVPHEQDVTNAGNWIFSFPMKSPEGSKTVDDGMTAVEQLEHYLLYINHWSEHNVSITVYVREHEWMEVGAWVFKHFDMINGISFLPYTDHVYRQAPYQKITAEEYETLLAAFPVVDFSKYSVDEFEDNTQGAQMLACVAGNCEI